MVAEGWGEKEICTKGVVMVKNKERGGGVKAIVVSFYLLNYSELIQLRMFGCS